jgi:hypothetical protein
MRRLAVIMVATLCALGGIAYAMLEIRAAGKPARFKLSVTPAHRSPVRGQTAIFSVDVARARSFTGATTLRVAGLPRGVRPRWRLADGTRSGVVPPAEAGAILTLRISRRTPLGTRRVKVLARGGGTRRARKLTLTVIRPGSRSFSLRVRPSRQIVPDGAAATYKIRVARSPGFRRRVKLRVLRMPRRRVKLRVLRRPRGARARRSITALTVATRAGQRPGSRRLVVQATSRVRGRTVRRYAMVVLTVVRARQFPISGDLTTPLYPGGGAPLDLILTNPHPFDIRVTALSVRVRAGTTNPGCSGDANFAVTQYSGGYPLVLRPGSTRLSALVSNSASWPQVSMHNLPTNQDACKNTRLFLDYEGLATR